MVNKNLREIRCKDCGNLLAYFSKEDNCYRIKYKDLFVKCYGKVEITCRKCGKVNMFDFVKIRL